MKNRDMPENMKNSPDFVKIMFDEKGHPLGIKPLKGVPYFPDNNGDKIKDAPQKTVVHKPVEQEVLINWISDLGQYIKGLREDFRLIAVFNQKKFNELEKIIVENSQYKNSSIFIEKVKIIENEISNLKNQYDHVLENLQVASNDIKNLTKKLETMKIPDNEIFDQLNLIDVSVSNQINVLKEKLEGMKLPEGLIYDQLNSIDLRMSTFAKEISDTKMYELETNQKLKSFIGEIEGCKTLNLETFQKLNVIDDEINELKNEIVLSKNHIEDISSNVNQKLNEFPLIREELDSMKTQTDRSIKELSENQKQMEILLVNQEKVSRDLAKNTVLEIQKMFKKPKKRVTKPTRAKVVRFLRRNFRIKIFSKVLVVADKKNSTFGKTLHEATRNISKKSIFVVVENKTKTSTIDKPVVEAIKKSNYVFIVGKYNFRKMNEMFKSMKRVKIVPIKRTLKYSIF